MSIAARLVDGSPLPTWLKWDPARLSYYGVPRVSDVGRLQLALIATDRQGASTQTSFTLATSAINRAPALNPAFSNLDWKISQSNQFKIPDNLFIDPNQDDALRYQLTMADGTQLPEWLRFDPISNTISSQPVLASMFKPIQLKLTAVGLGGLSNSAVLSVVTPTTGTNGDDNLWGSAADDILRGFSGNDILDAKGGNDQLSGGSGEDTLIGGAGNDSYGFDTDLALGSDTLNEAGGGIDTLNFSDTTTRSVAVNLGLAASQVVNAGLSLTLGSASTVENVIGGALADTLTGNGLANSLTGGGGNDTLNGGAGNDTLIGGAGADRFRFATTLNATTNRDVISDFSIAQADRIELENAVFTVLTTTGTLAASAFFIGAAATTAAQRILYNSGTGNLLYDSDGTGAAGSIAFATLTTGLVGLNNTFFTVT